MKKQITHLFVVLIIANTNAQKIESTTNIDSPMGIAYHDNHLYIANNNKVSKIDTTVENPEIIDVISGLAKPLAITIVNN